VAKEVKRRADKVASKVAAEKEAAEFWKAKPKGIEVGRCRLPQVDSELTALVFST